VARLVAARRLAVDARAVDGVRAVVDVHDSASDGAGVPSEW
jgi:hypothetical protein